MASSKIIYKGLESLARVLFSKMRSIANIMFRLARRKERVILDSKLVCVQCEESSER